MKQQNVTNKWTPFLWIAAFVLALGLLFARAVYPELVRLTVAIAILLFGVMGVLINQNRKALRSRSAAYGFNSLITIVLVIGIVGVLNFLVARYPQKIDMTKNKLHTLSDQTEKLIKGLKSPLKATFFGKVEQREQFRPLLDNYKALNPKFEIEFVNPDKEPTRAKQMEIRKYGTLHLAFGARTAKIEEVSEEKLTNELIKLTREKTSTLCSVTGHGEKSFGSAEADGYDAAKKALAQQTYEVKDVNLITDAKDGKLPAFCDAVAILGPTRPLFANEAKIIGDYLANGGRAVVALDINLKGGDYAPELVAVLNTWNVKASDTMIVDPLSRMLGVDASVPVLLSFSKDHPITRDFQANCPFPFTRPVEPSSAKTEGLTVTALGQTSPKSWAVTDLKALAGGQAKFTEGKDRQGPLSAAVAVSGKLKDSKATRETRLVVFGSSNFATNSYSRLGGNLDFFLNAVSWTLEDESMISIRAKEDGPGKVELSEKQGTVIFLVTVILIPLLIAVSGIVIWIWRRRL